MRVVSIVTTWGYSPGGVEQYVKSSAEVLMHLGHEHSIVSVWARGSWAGEPNLTLSKGEAPPLWRQQVKDGVVAIRAIHDLLARENDVLLLHGVIPTLAAVLRRNHSSTTKLIGVNYFPLGLEHRVERKALSARPTPVRSLETVLDGLERSALGRLDEIVVLSSYGAKLLGRLGRVAQIIPPYVPSSPQQSRGLLSEGPLVVLRRMAPRMGHAELLSSLAPLLQSENLQLIMAGTGPMEASIRSQASALRLENHVSLPGQISEAQREKLYTEARLALVPAKGGEGFGIAAAEAIAHGVPPVVAALPTLIELAAPVSEDLIVRKDWAHSLRTLNRYTERSAGQLQARLRRQQGSFDLQSSARRWDRALKRG